MNTSLALALSTLSSTTPANTDPPKATVLTMPKGLSVAEERIYAYAASQSAATAQERWDWRVRHAQIAAGIKKWGVDTSTTLHSLLPWTERDSVPAWMRELERESAQLYGLYAASMRAQRMEALAERVVNALERVAHAVAPVEAPVAPAPQLDATTAARFEALEAANAANAKILAAIAAKVGVKVGVTPRRSA